MNYPQRIDAMDCPSRHHESEASVGISDGPTKQVAQEKRKDTMRPSPAGTSPARFGWFFCLYVVIGFSKDYV
jgi:hypothetical protein